jgi:hypothetical protein
MRSITPPGELFLLGLPSLATAMKWNSITDQN